MKPFRIVRQASGRYPIWLGRGILEKAGHLLETIPVEGSCVLLAAGGVPREWIARIRNGIAEELPELRFPDSETEKTMANAEAIVGSLIELGATRSSVAIVVGGGTAGDTGGFAAAIFMRGIRYVHVPTTLLAQVDSSIGGKLGVNHPLGKNLIGLFALPAAIIADLDTLQTLPPRELRSGLFEALKGGVIGDPALFELMELKGERIRMGGGEIDEVVARAIDVKIGIVSEDEREGDRRRLLNYGHTIGHGFETAAEYAGLTHGDAIAWGMIAANAIAAERGMLASAIRRRIDDAILSYGPAPLPSVRKEAVFSAISHDKKFTGGKRVMVLPREVGACEICEDITAEEIARGMEIALEASTKG